MTMPDSTSTAPTERSIPPVMMTAVMPMAMMATNAKLRVTLNRAADVIVRMDLGTNADDAVWQDRDPTAAEQATFDGHLENERRRVGADEKGVS